MTNHQHEWEGVIGRHGRAGPTWRARAREGLVRGLVLAVIWWAIVEGDHEAWWVGIPVIAAAVVASLWLMPPQRLRLSLVGLLRFLPYFVAQSFLGGLDVTRRALQRRLELAPDIIAHRVRLQSHAPLVLFVNAISLMPGTLSTRFEDGVVHVHALDRRLPIARQLARLERRIAGLYRLSWRPREGAP